MFVQRTPEKRQRCERGPRVHAAPRAPAGPAPRPGARGPAGVCATKARPCGAEKPPSWLVSALTESQRAFREGSRGQGQAFLPLLVYGTLKSRGQQPANVRMSVKMPLRLFLLEPALGVRGSRRAAPPPRGAWGGVPAPALVPAPLEPWPFAARSVSPGRCSAGSRRREAGLPGEDLSSSTLPPRLRPPLCCLCCCRARAPPDSGSAREAGQAAVRTADRRCGGGACALSFVSHILAESPSVRCFLFSVQDAEAR